MRESMVREIYYGNLNPWERKRVYNPERIALNDKIDGIVEHFKNLLSPEEYKKFATIRTGQILRKSSAKRYLARNGYLLLKSSSCRSYNERESAGRRDA